MSEKQRFAVRESVEIWDERSGSLLAHAVSGDRAILIVAALNAAYVRQTEPKPQDSATSTYHVYGSHDLVNQTVCYKVRRKDAEGVEYLVAQFDNFLAAIKERDRLNAEAKAALQPAADPVDAPDHYRQGEIECIDAVKAMLGDEGFAYWLRGNMVAYLWRMPHKGKPAEDAGKTRNMAERLVRLLGG